MTRSPLIERLSGVIAPAVATLDASLWGIELASAGSRMVIRVFIDAEAGVTIALCARVSRHLGALFDAEDVLPGAYVLEVSSPGLERRFFSPGQLVSFIGRVVDVRLHEPQDGRRHLHGVLAEAAAGELAVDEAGVVTRIAWERVKNAHLVHEFPGAAPQG